MTDLRQAAQQALEALESGLAFDTHSVVLQNLRTALEQQAEPGVWDKPSASFNAWWDSYRHDPANPFAEGSAAYWAWAGWQAAQRKWVGLTDEDFLEACQLAEHGNYLVAFQRIQIKLKERNT